MNIFNLLKSKPSPSSVARREVDGFLQELNSRPREGDPALHQKLHQLNEKAGALNPEVLTEAYVGGSEETSQFAGLRRVSYALDAGQAGFARELAAQIMADGHYSEPENLAVRQMTNPPRGLKGYGPGVGQQLLSPRESNVLRTFSAAPNDDIRNWMLEQSQAKPVDLPAAQALGEKLFENGSLDVSGWGYAASLNYVFDAPVEPSSKFFLLALRGTDPDLQVYMDKDTRTSYRNRARAHDSGSSQQPGPCEEAYLAGLEFARQKGLADSAQARSLFPQK